MLIRHGRAEAGWDIANDPGLDEVGRTQAIAMADIVAPQGPMSLFSSPLLRTQQTAEPLAARWGTAAAIDPAVMEIPSPQGIAMADRVTWLRAAMGGTWEGLGSPYIEFRDTVVRRIQSVTEQTVFVSHFVAINAVIGACVGDDRMVIASLDNCSITEIDVAEDGTLTLIHHGHEANTLIR